MGEARTLPPGVPGYWMNETGGRLRPAVEAYIKGERLAPHQVATVRAYLRQWINAPGFRGPHVEALRRDVDGVLNQEALDAWINRAVAVGCDPL